MSELFNSTLMCVLLSMAPISELRGAIPYGLAHDVPVALLYPLCVLANLVPVPFITIFLRRVLKWMEHRGGKLQKAANWLTSRGQRKAALYRKYALFGLFVLVAVPLPGTGAWTGALVASLLGVRMNQSLPTIGAGVAVAGGLVLLVCKGVIHIAGLV